MRFFGVLTELLECALVIKRELIGLRDDVRALTRAINDANPTTTISDAPTGPD